MTMSDWLSPNPPRIANPLCTSKNEIENYRHINPYNFNSVFFKQSILFH